MAAYELNDKTVIADFQKPYMVAEVNTSHNGNMKTAKKMIEEAKKAGCDCVKFQSWSAQSLYSKTYYEENPVAERMMQKFAVPQEALRELAEYCHALGLAFSSTPYSRKEVDFLAGLSHTAFIKVASMDITYDPFLKIIAQTGLPIVLSTGMATMEEIEHAVEVIEQAGNSRICLLHCVSLYPPQIKAIRLNNITGLRRRFPQCPIGFSDHSSGIGLAAAAVSMGAALIEKHFTLDKKKMGMDNHMAAEPEEMRMLTAACRDVFAALGTQERVISREEIEQRTKMRRSIIAARDIPKGKALAWEDLDAKRPGTGIPAADMEKLIGRRALRSIMADTVLYVGDVL